jgi:hypothetical protein
MTGEQALRKRFLNPRVAGGQTPWISVVCPRMSSDANGAGKR